jgi:hypothetical protein
MLPSSALFTADSLPLILFISCYDECRYAECGYAECRYAECRRGASSVIKHYLLH